MEPLAASPNTQGTHGWQSSLSLAEPEPSVCLHVALPDGFSLPAAVCSYGFFMMAPTVWIPPRGSESTAQGGLGVKREAEEAAGEPGSAEGGRREAGDGREGEEGSGKDAERKGLHEEGDRGSSGNAWGGGEQAWGAVERPLRLADGRAVMVRITQHGAADVTQHGAADVTRHGADDVTQHSAADVTEVSSGAMVYAGDGSSGTVPRNSAAFSALRGTTTSDGAAAAGTGSHGTSVAARGSGGSTSVAVQQGSWLRVRVMGMARITAADHAHLLAQVQRMLRLSPACQAAVQAFHRRHPAAAAAGFGRLFRSPSLFEDLVKAQLLCN
ncbi:unnamed protein product, partial [Closterium sp. NIES-54]